jgi:hypothetical protein
MIISRNLKIAMMLVGLTLGVVYALWYPYESGTVPEWKLQVVDPNGKPVVGAQVNQEWINPIEDGMVSADSRTTDASGVVLFPKRFCTIDLRSEPAIPLQVADCLSAGRMTSGTLIGTETRCIYTPSLC